MRIGSLDVSLNSAFVLLVLLLLALALRSRRNSLRHPLWSLFRVLFPSYRFFDDVAPMPALYVRCGPAPNALGDWLPALPCPARHICLPFWNPAGNLHLAHGSLLERLLSELADRSPIALVDAEGLSAFQMVALLAAEEAARLAPSAAFFQFKLRYGEPEQDVLLSREAALSTRPSP